MSTRIFALVFGIVFLLAGIAGFIPPLLTPPDQPITVNVMHGLLFGLFPVNALHNLVHIGFGVYGLFAWRGLTSPLTYARVVAIAYGVLTFAGFIPGLNTVFGVIPIQGHDVWLHFLLAAIAAYFGFYTSESEKVEGEASHRRAAAH